MRLMKIEQEGKNKISLKAFSKINFALWVKEKRKDKYHNIESIVFENENLYDEVQIDFTPASTLRINVNFLPVILNQTIPTEQNLAFIAAKLFFEKIGYKGICNININKKIPIFSGLGGGSSNAMSVLTGLNTIFDYQLHRTELLLLASQIGSDVPFFLFGGTCYVKGKGDIIEQIENKLNIEVKIVKLEDISISTKWAYDEVDKLKIKKDHKSQMKNLIHSMKKGNYEIFFDNIFNDFEDVAFSYYPKLKDLKQSLLTEGYQCSGLCGSGSAIFALRQIK